MNALKSILFWYFAIVGVSLHLAAGTLWVLEPQWVWGLEQWARGQLVERVPSLAAAKAEQRRVTAAAVAAALPPWRPLPAGAEAPLPGTARSAGTPYATVAAALAAARPGDTLEVGAGVYTAPLVIRVPGIAITGRGHVVFEKGAAQGKANMVVAANDVRLRNIECRFISVPDRNGACVRAAGMRDER